MLVVVVLLTCSLVKISFVLTQSNVKKSLQGNSNFEIIIPKVFDDGEKRYRRDFIPQKRQHFRDRLAVEFHGFGRFFSLKLHKNDVLLPKSFRAFVMNSDGSIDQAKPIENCYYHGHIENTESTVVMETCHGIRGYFHDYKSNNGYIIEPYNMSNNSSKPEHIIYKADVVNKELFQRKCGHTHMYNDEHTPITFSKRQKRSVVDQKYIEVVAVTDANHVKKFGKSGSINRAVEVMNYVDAVYKTLDTRVALIGVVAFDGVDQFPISPSAEKTLSEFQKFVSTKIHKEKLFGDLNPDNCQLLSGVTFTSSQVGLAGVGDICSYTSAAVNKDHNTALVTANTVAHELGHNLGFFHSDGCTCKDLPCVMTGTVPYTQVRGFSDCTQNKWQQILSSGDASCIFNYPEKLYGDAKCGNGYKESGEECDCGSEKECEVNGGSKCCDPTNCKLKTHAQCATGPCCKECKFKKQGELCRSKVNAECDLEEFCVGNSSECQKNYYVQDGIQCDSGNAYCYKGACKNYTTQCKTLWGENAVKAHNACFANNKRGDQFGNCGETEEPGKYKKCQDRNTVCGKLQCSGKSESHPLPEFPIMGSSRGRKEVYFKSGSKTIKCVMGKTSLGKDMFDPTMALQGTKCGENKICIENECTNITSLSDIKKCLRPCLNGGICNNNGNCHCPVGFACPYCESKGVGGSLDSGQGCNLTNGTGNGTGNGNGNGTGNGTGNGNGNGTGNGNGNGTGNGNGNGTVNGNNTDVGTKGSSLCGQDGNEPCYSPSKLGLLVFLLLLVPLVCLKLYCTCCHGNHVKTPWRRYQRVSKSSRSNNETSLKNVEVTDIDENLVCFCKIYPNSSTHTSSKSRNGFFPLFPDKPYNVTNIQVSQPLKSGFYEPATHSIKYETSLKVYTNGKSNNNLDQRIQSTSNDKSVSDESSFSKTL